MGGGGGGGGKVNLLVFMTLSIHGPRFGHWHAMIRVTIPKAVSGVPAHDISNSDSS